MNAVRLVELRPPTDTFQNKRNEGELILFRQIAVDLAILASIFFPQIRWSFHAGQDYHHASLLGTLDDPRQIIFHYTDRLAPQGVITAEFEDQELDIFLLQGPVDSSHPPG